MPFPLPNAPGCSVFAAPDATLFLLTTAAGTATHSVGVPSATSYIGVELFHQWAVLDAANPLGIIVSDAGRAWLGL